MRRSHSHPRPRIIDLTLLLATQALLSPLLDHPAVLIHHLIGTPALLTSGCIGVWLLDPHKWITIMYLACAAEAMNGVVKFLVGRPRPFWVSAKVKNIRGSSEADYSFPSSHAGLVACFAVALARPGLLQSMSTSIFLGTLVILTGITRVLLGVHYPSDVVVGWAVGAIAPYVWFGMGGKTIKDTSTWTKAILGLVVPVLLLGWLWALREEKETEAVRMKWEETAKNAIRKSTRPQRADSFKIKPRKVETYFVQLAYMLIAPVGLLMVETLENRDIFILRDIGWWKLLRIPIGIIGMVPFIIILETVIGKLKGGRKVLAEGLIMVGMMAWCLVGTAFVYKWLEI